MDDYISWNGYYYSVVNLLFSGIYMFLVPFWIISFFGHFMERRIRNRRWNAILITVVNALANCIYNVAMNWLCRAYDISDFTLIIDCILSSCVILLVGMCFYKASLKMFIFSIVTYVGISEVAGLFGLFFSSENKIISYAIAILIKHFQIRYITKKIYIKDFIVQKLDLLVLITPCLLCELFGLVVSIMKNDMQQEIMAIYKKTSVFYCIMMIIVLLSMISILYGLTRFQTMFLMNKENNTRIVLEKQMENLQQYTSEMERIWTGIRCLKHDMRNTISVVTQISSEKMPEGQKIMKEYLVGLQDAVEKLELRFKTGNIVADTILSMKYQEAIKNLPDLKMDVDMLFFPENMPIKSYDLGIILGNALDNALEACREMRVNDPDAEVYIRASTSRKRNLFLLEIENSFNGELILTEHSEFPKTKKADKELHGMGLTNIKNAADKYQGAVVWTAEEKVFYLSVMLKTTMQEDV